LCRYKKQKAKCSAKWRQHGIAQWFSRELEHPRFSHNCHEGSPASALECLRPRLYISKHFRLGTDAPHWLRKTSSIFVFSFSQDEAVTKFIMPYHIACVVPCAEWYLPMSCSVTFYLIRRHGVDRGHAFNQTCLARLRHIQWVQDRRFNIYCTWSHLSLSLL